MHYKIGVTCVYNGHKIYSAVITRQSNPPISKFSRPCNEIMSVWSMFLCNTNSNEQCYVNEGVPFRM